MPYCQQLRDVPGVPAPAARELERVTDKFPFRASDYYLSLIDWQNENDPLRAIVIPDARELDGWGKLDPSDEHAHTRLPGVQHKYPLTALLLVSDTCAGICRFCFRKRLFLQEQPETLTDLDAGLHYISRHLELTNVLLTGGDALMLPTPRLEEILRRLRQMPHVKIIRLGSKVPAYNPHRLLDDPELLTSLARYSQPDRRIYVMTHFNHPRELTETALSALDRLTRAGVILANQTPLLRGVNATPKVLAQLFKRLSFAGVVPYYVFICRPSLGNRHFAVPIEEAYDIFIQAQMDCSGLAKRARLVMSHATGKIEVVGRSEGKVYFRYHRAANLSKVGEFMVYPSNPAAYWLEDYPDAAETCAPARTYASAGPE